MSRRNVSSAIFLSVALSLIFVAAAIAGTFDFGDVPGSPPVGEVNWTAWLDKKLPGGGGPPAQVITEDNTNSGLGKDGGYTLVSSIPRWLMQVENLDDSQNNDQVSMILSGLGASSGPLWEDAFAWVSGGGSTYQGVANTLHADNHPCPSLTSHTSNGTSRTFTWEGAIGTYYVYKSTQESGCCDGTPNGASNGRFDFLAIVTTSDGNGSYTDTCTDPKCWYMVIHADEDGNIDGCHSEEVDPTAVTLSDFKANGMPGFIQLEWETASEIDLLSFNIYRSTSYDIIGDRLNHKPIIPEHPGTNWGSQYIFDDVTCELGVPYYYWLELVATTGTTNPVVEGPAEAYYAVYLSNIMQIP